MARPCLTHGLRACRGDARLDVVVADNESTDGTRELVETSSRRRASSLRKPRLRPREQPRLLMTTQRAVRPLPQPRHRDRRRHLPRADRDARRRGRASASWASAADARTASSTRRSGASRTLCGRSARRSAPSACRSGPVARRAGARLDLVRHGVLRDWTSGSFMLCGERRSRAPGYFDERFFIYSRGDGHVPPDQERGWSIYHFPVMTIRHHFDTVALQPTARGAARLRVAAITPRRTSRPSTRLSTSERSGLGTRSDPCCRVGDEEQRQRRTGSRAGSLALAGLRPPPYGEAPQQAVAIRSEPQDGDAERRSAWLARRWSRRRRRLERLLHDLAAPSPARPPRPAAGRRGRAGRARCARPSAPSESRSRRGSRAGTPCDGRGSARAAGVPSR